MEGDDFDLRRPNNLWPQDFLFFGFTEVLTTSFADVKFFNERKL